MYAHVYVRQGTCVLCMYVCTYLGSVCGSLAVCLAPGGGCEGVNKENEEVPYLHVSQLQVQGSQENT